MISSNPTRKRHTAAEFLAQSKAVTLIGMSGAGKTYLSSMLAAQGWAHYSSDYLIASRFLQPPLPAVTPDNLSALSAFVSKPGNPAQGGLLLDEFKWRQRLYYEAECQAVAELGAARAAARAKGQENFIHDSTGSFCEITDEKLLAEAGAQTLIIYITSSPQDVETLIDRARQYPKPLFFPADRLDGWLQTFMQEEGVQTSDQINPDAFTRWVFPHLLQSRLPKYQRLADLYGVTIPASVMGGVKTTDQFLHTITTALDEQG